MVDADEILPEAEEHRTKWKDHVRDVADIFHKNEGELFTRVEAIELITEEISVDKSTATRTLSALTSDLVDPVVQIPVDGERYIGIVEYNEYDGAYGYKMYDDVTGEANRVVCAQCVKEKTFDKNVTNATSGAGSFSEDASFDELLQAVHHHYDDSHDEMPENVETGASLISGTTIGSGTAIHSANESTLSFFNGTDLTVDTTGDAASVDGYDIQLNGTDGSGIINFKT